MNSFEKFLIDLLRGKSYIIIITIISTLIGGAYSLRSSYEQVYIAETDVRPLREYELSVFDQFNNMGIYELNPELTKSFKVDSDLLLELFIQNARKRDSMFQAALETKFFNENEFDSNREYKEYVKNFVDSILIQQYREPETKKKYYTLIGKTEDKSKWVNFIKVFHRIASEETKESVNERLLSLIDIIQKQRNFKLDSIQTAQQLIEIDIKKYINNKVKHLERQLSIAKQIDLDKNTSISNPLLSPEMIYLRGSIPLSQEIKFNKEGVLPEFDSGLTSLNSLKQSVLKDNINVVPQKLIDSLHRSVKEDLIDNNNFRYAHISTDESKFYFKSRRALVIVISSIIGFIIGVFFVLGKEFFLGLRRLAKENS